LAKQKKKNKSTTLEAFYEEYLPEIKKNIEVWKEIRDNKEESGRDRIEAGKNISKNIFQILATTIKQTPEKAKSEFSKEEKEEIQKDVKKVLESLDSGSYEEY